MSSSTRSARRPRGIYLLPNLLTTAGLFAGFYAIIAATQGRFVAACIAIVVAAVMDGLDGRIARMTNTQSDFGMQYDSLADLVSFGMAPSLVMFHFALADLRDVSILAGKLGWGAAFVYAACAAVRLARFNTQSAGSDKRWFIGLASPAAAGVMVSFVWLMRDYGIDGSAVGWLAFAVTLVVGLLMISRFRYYSFKQFSLVERVPFIGVLAGVLLIYAASADPPHVLSLVTGVYLLSGPAWWLWQRRRRELPGRGATGAASDPAEDR